MARFSRAASDSCLHGHPFPENLLIDSRGWANCVECRRRSARQHYSRYYVRATPDPVAVERAVAADAPEQLTPSERVAAVIQLDARGLSARQIAERIRCTSRTVHRIRGRIRQTAA